MKKYINKLFEWLGYVQKDVYVSKDIYDNILETSEDLQTIVDYYTTAIKDIQDGYVRYAIWECNDIFVVFSLSRGSENDVMYPIKAFRFTEDTQDYARICAEELCDMLNEKY